MSGFTSVTAVSDNGWRLTMESTDSGYLLSNVDLGQPTEEDNTYRIPYSHGEQYDAMRIGPRDITISGHCFNGDYRRMEMVFSPFSFVTLTLERGGVVRTARGKPNGVFRPNKNPPYDFTVIIRCFDPFFYEPEQRVGVYTTDTTGIYESLFHNTGDADAPLRIEMIAKEFDGSEVYFQLKETGERIAFSGITGRMSIQICTADDNRYIKKAGDDGEDLSMYLTPDIVFFQVPPGRYTLQSNCLAGVYLTMRHLEI